MSVGDTVRTLTTRSGSIPLFCKNGARARTYTHTHTHRGAMGIVFTGQLTLTKPRWGIFLVLIVIARTHNGKTAHADAQNGVDKSRTYFRPVLGSQTMYSKCTSEVCSSTYAYAVVQTRAEFSTELHAYFQIVTRQPTPGKKNVTSVSCARNWCHFRCGWNLLINI